MINNWPVDAAVLNASDDVPTKCFRESKVSQNVSFIAGH